VSTVLSGCGSETPEARKSSTTDSRSAASYVGANTAQFGTWSNVHHNSIATVTGEVEELLGANAFTLAGRNGVSDLLVVGKDNALNLKRGDTVVATGAVKPTFEQQRAEARLHVFLGTAVRRFENRRYLQATNTALTSD